MVSGMDVRGHPGPYPSVSTSIRSSSPSGQDSGPAAGDGEHVAATWLLNICMRDGILAGKKKDFEKTLLREKKGKKLCCGNDELRPAVRLVSFQNTEVLCSVHPSHDSTHELRTTRRR